eukprot:1346149-Amphidinium_carterae.2
MTHSALPRSSHRCLAVCALHSRWPEAMRQHTSPHNPLSSEAITIPNTDHCPCLDKESLVQALLGRDAMQAFEFFSGHLPSLHTTFTPTVPAKLQGVQHMIAISTFTF